LLLVKVRVSLEKFRFEVKSQFESGAVRPDGRDWAYRFIRRNPRAFFLERWLGTVTFRGEYVFVSAHDPAWAIMHVRFMKSSFSPLAGNRVYE
jgi:hypothetical protein